MLLGRIKYRRDWKFVYKEDERFLRILDGSTILNIRETDRLILYKRDYMLAPVKPGKLICADFSCIKPTTAIVSPYTPILIPERGIRSVFARLSVVAIAGEEDILAWGLALNIHLRHFGDVRDYAIDTSLIMTEFLQTDAYHPTSYSIRIGRKGWSDRIEGETPPIDLEEKLKQVRRYFLMYPQDAIAIDTHWTIILRPGDSLQMESPLGNLETKVMWKDEYTT